MSFFGFFSAFEPPRDRGDRGDRGSDDPSADGSITATGPYRALSYARLVIPSGASRLEISGDPTLPGLYRMTPGRSSRIEERDGTVTFHPGHAASLTLGTACPWEIELRGGLDRCRFDLSRLELRTIAINGGVSNVELHLGRPVGLCPVRIGGGVSKLDLLRPPAAAVRLALNGGASKLTMDTYHFGAVGGPVRWESADYRNASDRYDLEIRGGASKLTIATA
jgi:hypothetical protein